MTSGDRKIARYERRRERREQKRKDTVSQYDNFANIVDPDNLIEAFRKSRQGVSWKESTQRYESKLLKNIAETRRKLLAAENVTHGFVEFNLCERGRLRHIKSVHISERVVQKCLCDQSLVPLLSRSLIYDNGASLKDKGLHFSIKRFIHHLSSYYRSKGFSNAGYCLSIDFSKFFDTIRHDVLLESLEKIIHDTRILKLIRDFIAPFGNGISLGLGSQVSQIAAIYYPNRLDHYIKEILRIKFYGRYMDDMYLIHQDKQYLGYCLTEIKRICGTLGITINDKKTRIIKLQDGVRFLKGIYTLTENGKILRRASPDSRKRMRRKLRKFKKLLVDGKIAHEDIRTAYQSWRGGYMKRFDAYHTIRRMDDLYNSLFIGRG